MRLGKTHLAGRQEGEVRYYDPSTGPSVFAADLGQTVSQPYGAWHLEAMDAHGGWLASAVDLARFACAFDEPTNSPVLKPESIVEMFSRPRPTAAPDQAGNGKPSDGKPDDAFYALGWNVRPVGSEGLANMWHTGSLPGTSTILIRRHDGKNIVILFNSRVSPHVDHLTKAIDPQVHAAIDEVRDWPTTDLFGEYR